MPRLEALVVDDEPASQRAVGRVLQREGLDVAFASSITEAKDIVGARPPDLVTIDVCMSGAPDDKQGLTFAAWLRRHHPRVARIVVTCSDAVEHALQAANVGVQHYVFKDEIVRKLPEAVRAVLRAPARREAWTGASLVSERVRTWISTWGPTRLPVLITGESGTGKSLIAQLLHAEGAEGGEGWLEIIDCASRDAVRRLRLCSSSARSTRGEAATIVLDDIAALSLEAQARLVLLLDAEERTPSRTRFIAVSRYDLGARATEGTFERALLDRFVGRMKTPSFFERLEDIDDLLADFVDLSPHRLECVPEALDDLRTRARAMGSIRELRNACLQLATELAGRYAEKSDVEGILGSHEAASDDRTKLDQIAQLTLGLTTSGNKPLEVLRHTVTAAIALHRGNKAAAARALGMKAGAVTRRSRPIADAAE